jgi:hypothetical protein
MSKKTSRPGKSSLPISHLDSFFLAAYFMLTSSRKPDSLVSCEKIIVISTKGGKSNAVHQSER